MLKPLNHILGVIENKPQWQGPREFQHLLNIWSEVVGEAVADQTRPCSISRDVLYVATSSSVWVQELKFRRRSILKKLNARLSTLLIDLHFSTTQWQKTSTPTFGEDVAALWQEHPSRVVESSAVPTSQTDLPQDAGSVFQNWATLVQARSLSLPPCPDCQCPTPPGELERWNVCGLCAVKPWQL
jgi:predicted nucleic acid-binding Zn ribbon protein